MKGLVVLGSVMIVVGAMVYVYWPQIMKRLKRPVEYTMMKYDGVNKPVRVRDTDEGKNFQSLYVQKVCPVCGGKDFMILYGPEGGLSVNIVTDCCGTRFNVTQFSTGEGTAELIQIREFPQYVRTTA